MTHLITIGKTDISGQQKETINARELHQFVESSQEFANWIKNRIRKYNFIQNEDFIKHDKFIMVEGSNLKRTQIDYHITLDMAKELAMIENNDKGREIRKYFIACENKSKEVAKLTRQIDLLNWMLKERNMDLANHCMREKYLYDFIIDSGMNLPELIS